MLFAIASSLCAAASASLLPSSGPRLRSLSPRVRAAPLMQVAGAELTLERWLSDCGASESLSEVVLALGGACMDVAERVRTASCDSYSCFNEHHSDERMSGVAIDLVAEQLMVDALRGTGCVAAVSTPLDPLGCLDPAGQYSEDVDLVQQRQRRERLSGSVPAAVPADLGSRRGTASPRWPERCVVTGGRAALGVLSASVDPLHGASPPPPGAPTARAAAHLPPPPRRAAARPQARQSSTQTSRWGRSSGCGARRRCST